MEDTTRGLKVRQLALQVLERILIDGNTFDEALAGTAGAADLDPRDRGFVSAIVLTVLRHKGETNAVIAKFLAKSLPDSS